MQIYETKIFFEVLENLIYQSFTLWQMILILLIGWHETRNHHQEAEYSSMLL